MPCAECDTELKELSVEEEFETADDFETTVVEAIKASVPEQYRDKVTEEWVESRGGDGLLAARCKIKYEFDNHENTFSDEKVKGKAMKGVTVTGTVKRTIHVSIPGHPGTEIVDDLDFEQTVADAPSAFDELT
jgi:hypothetical protein